MQKKEWVVAVSMLCVLALCACVFTAFVLQKNQLENVAAFENRFLDLTRMGLMASNGILFQNDERKLTAEWQETSQELVLETAVQPLPEGCREWRLDLGGGGNRNARQEERWGYQVWLELVMLDQGQPVASERIELPMEAERSDRTRIYTAHSDAVAADGWKLRAIITPVNDVVAEGSLILKNWEVYAR